MNEIDNKSLKLNLRLVGLLLLLMMSNHAIAGWTQISENENNIAYADASTIIKTGSKVKMWDVLNLKNTTNENYASLKSLQEYDCKENKSRILSYSTYSEKMGSGNVVKSSTSAHEWLPVKHGGTTEKLWKTACEKK
ncbi:hypothetical protein GALL_19200 [mine drainage metagenome]|uniref:Surface-adhesin protein E-like domain-containing protein n=1 Tax=mine drainage metagenome TaxID=410659 RepID=A0A1J5TA05_9ZZZZ